MSFFRTTHIKIIVFDVSVGEKFLPQFPKLEHIVEIYLTVTRYILQVKHVKLKTLTLKLQFKIYLAIQSDSA